MHATGRGLLIDAVLQDEPTFRRGCPIRILVSLEHVSLVFIWKWWQGLVSFIFFFFSTLAAHRPLDGTDAL